MMTHTGKLAVSAACLFLAITVVASAQEEGSVLVEPQPAQAAEGPAMVSPAPVVEEAIPAPIPTTVDAAPAVVKPAPPIVAHASLRARRLYGKQQMVNLVMVAKNPADCCLYEIPLCVPACCIGEPKMTERRGLLGRGIVEYCWPCGFTATVKFRPLLDDVKIRYDG